MIRIPENDTLAELRPVAFDVIYRLGDRLVEHWNGIDPGLLERARRNREAVMAQRSQRCGWRHPGDPGYVLKEPGSYKTILTFPELSEEDARRLRGALTSIGTQRDLWAHQPPALIDHPGPSGHLTALARDTVFAAETLGFTDLIDPLDRLRATLEDGRVREATHAPASVEPPPVVFRIGAPTEVPYASRLARLMGGRIWGDDGRSFELPEGETRTDVELARVWSRIIGTRDATVWIAPDGRVVVEHAGKHWVLDVVGPSRPARAPGEPLLGWVVERCRALLDTDGSIWDYVSGKRYFEAGTPLGERLLEELEDGGPIQITADGAVGAQIDESGDSVYIASLDETELETFLA